MASLGLDFDLNSGCFTSSNSPRQSIQTRPAAHPPIGTRRAFPNPKMQISLPETEIESEYPDFPAYPPEAVEIRNTFIHVASPAVEDADRRPVLSCPASHIGWLHDIFEEDAPLPPAKKETPRAAASSLRPVICLEDALVDCGPVEHPYPPGPVRLELNQWGTHSQVPMPHERSELPVSNLSRAPAPVLPAPLEPAPGSPELPSLGSKGHHRGDCRPCGFLYAKGCINGAMCTFCHLCDRGAKKRRQKAKKAALKGGA